jgi:O-antigen/teichoic acid export membrane protein
MGVRSKFTRNVLVLLSGTSVAQALPIAVTPILARLFSPGDFGLLYLFAAISSMLAMLSTGKYEMAILLPEEEEEADQLWVLSALLSLCSGLLFFFIFLFTREIIAGWLNEPDLAFIFLLLPLQVCIYSLNETFRYWFNRREKFGILSLSQIILSVSNALGRMGMGWLRLGGLGLVLGTVMAQLILLLYLIARFIRLGGRRIIEKVSLESLKKLAFRYQQFPRNMVSGGLFHSGANQSPPILLNSFYTAGVAGHYGIMNRLTRVPISTLGRAYEEVFKQQASEALRQSGHFRPLFFRTIAQLAGIAFLPFLALAFFAPDVFEWILGADWRQAGIYTRIFTLPMFLQFVLTPLLPVFYLGGKTKWYTLSHLFQLILVILAVLAARNWDPDETITVIYSLAGAYTLAYLISFVLMFIIIQKDQVREL